MATLTAWLSAARLRTLPLSVSGIIIGSASTVTTGQFSWGIFIGALVVTTCFQVLSNFANDYGDALKGTDNKNRVGPQRAIQSGAISPRAMKKAMVYTSIIAFGVALWLIYFSFGIEKMPYILLFLSLTIASIVAAIKYTVGKKAYGYSGLGDVFVFLFFGLLSVLGSYFLFTQTIVMSLFLPAITVGVFSVGVLNLNNLRDQKNDAACLKNTLVVKNGDAWGKKYHFTLLILGMLCGLCYAMFFSQGNYRFIFVLCFLPLIKNLQTVAKNKEPRLLDPELKKVALSTFLFAILFALGQIL